MKKFLILMLVLGMASAASATVTEYQGWYFKLAIDAPTVIDIGDTVGVEIFAGSDLDVASMLETVLNVSEAASISAIAISIEGDWSLAPVPTTSVDGDGFNVNVDGVLIAPIPAGHSIYSFSFTTLQAGTFTIDAVGGAWHTWIGVPGNGTEGEAYSNYGAQYGLPYSGPITVVPEPMTIALLGLGSLFLLRRRK